MESKHTPGPWKGHEIKHASGADSPRGWHVRNREISRGVCDLIPAKWESTSAEEIEANAALIAAAPGVLAACEGLGKNVDELGRLTRAIDLKCHPDARNLVAALTAVIRLAELVPYHAAIAKAKGGGA